MNLFETDENKKNVDIPDFVEDKGNADSSSVDMSIFKMSDEELYDDVKKENKKAAKNNGGKKKSNSTITLCLVVVGILLVVAIVASVFAVREHNATAALNEEITQLKASLSDKENALAQANGKVQELEKQINDMKIAGTVSDPNNKYPSGTVLYITEDGASQAARVKAAADSDNAVDAEGIPYAYYHGDKVTLIADATKDVDGNYWGQIDKGFIRIEYNGEVWATTEPQ